MSNNKRFSQRAPLSEAQRHARKKYLGATFVSCIVLSLIGGTVHVLELGENRMKQMREMAAIDLENERDYLRAAGESLYRNTAHEHRTIESSPYDIGSVVKMLTDAQWAELDTMISIPAGEFIMGTDHLKTDEQNRPQHTRYLANYRIDKYPITNAQYALFVAETDRRPPGNWSAGKFESSKLTHPVTMVTWFDARDYCAFLGKRIPTEAEWEKAARGIDGRRWPWGNRMDTEKLNTYYNVGDTNEVIKYTNGVSPYGVFDMSGNVQEWVFDQFAPYKESDAPEEMFIAKIPVLPESKAEQRMSIASFQKTDMRYKVMRGGSWKSDPFSTAVYHRNFQWPQKTTDFYGFRCAADMEP